MDRKQLIEKAIMRMKDMYMLYDRALQAGDNKQAAKTLTEAHRAQNELYDAIGGMDEYKFFDIKD